MTSKEVLEYLRTCKFCKIVMGTDYENDDRYFNIYDVFSEEIEIIEKDLNRLEEVEKENKRLKTDLEALEIIKEQGFLFVEKGKLYVGRYGDIEVLLEEDDFQDKHEYELLKEVFGNE